jgi:DNA invertase Pin-like site-specific DNA recombinase
MQVIGYTRVSTSGQASSGLGLAAQRTAIENFATAEGFRSPASTRIRRPTRARTLSSVGQGLLQRSRRRARPAHR